MTEPRNAPGRGPSSGSGRGWAIAGIICGALALVQIVPILFGPLGILFGAFGRSRGDRGLGMAAIIVSALGLIFFAIILLILIFAPPEAV